MSINDTCFIMCSECKGKLITSDKPKGQNTKYDFTVPYGEWEISPTLKCPRCGMTKTVTINKPRKVKRPNGQIAKVDNYVLLPHKGLRMVAIEATIGSMLR